MIRRLAVPLALLACLAAAGPAAAQCSMCKAVIEGAVEGRRIAEGLNHGILLMMAAPYAILGSFVAVAFRPRMSAAFARWRGQHPKPPAGGD